jgi:SAM-dependent methyltransferase
MMPTLTLAQEDALRQVPRKVRAMVEERRTTSPDGPSSQPSRYWTDFTAFFDYMTDLSPRSLAKVRLHTYHLTGDNYQTYYFGNRRAFFDFYGPWLEIDGLPAEHILSEPEDGIGFRLEDGRLVSADIARFQRSVSTLSRHRILDELTRWGSPPRVLEIGGGYGGLALHLSRILRGCRYVLVDLPETLIFSASYLALQAPAKRLYLYDPADRLDAAALADFDFVLLPDYRLEALNPFEFDLAINVASMQEMRVDQIERYLDFLRVRCRGVFYSCNRDRQNRNEELPGLFDHMRTRFELTEVPPPSDTAPSSWKARLRRGLRRTLRRAARSIGLIGPGSDGPAAEPFPYVEHLGHARSRTDGPSAPPGSGSARSGHQPGQTISR